MTDFTKQAEQFAEQMKAAMPKVTFNKNGYEIRTQVLDMAKSMSEFEYSAKFQQVEMTAKRDPETGEVVSNVQFPEIPGTDKVLEAAQKFYDFVNQSTAK
jgi:polyhydroxyalkanoate synthesis regulator protein